MAKANAGVYVGAAAVVALTGAIPALARDEDDRKLKSQRPATVALPLVGRAIRSWEFQPGGDNPNFDIRGMTLLSWLPLNTLPGWDPGRANSAADCWGYTSATGREYAAITVRRGTAFVEITDPENPRIVGFVEGAESLWHDVAIVGNYAYVCSEHGRGIQVIDLSRIDQGAVRWVRDVTTGGHTTTHTLVHSDNPRYIYANGGNIGNRGLVAFDLINPENPVAVGAWTNHYSHESQIITYTSGPYAGKEVAFVFGGLNSGWSQTRLSIVDVTNKGNMQLLGECYWPGAGYSHQGWVSNDRTLLYLNDELDEMNGTVPSTTARVIDITNLSRPTQVATFTNGLTAIDHNEYVRGNLLFQSNYRSGLRVWDLRADQRRPTEIAHLDTYPNDNLAEFNGNWGNYPFFASGTVIMSDMENGLIVTRVECYADCDTSTGAGTLDIFDFLCFQNRYDNRDPYACDCDLSTGPGSCDIFDFLCFQNAYNARCP